MSMLSNDALKFRRIIACLALLGAAPLMSGCAETIIGVGATGAVAASQERGLGGAVGDTQIRTAINFLWFEENTEMYHQLNLNVHEGRVMISGVVAKPEWKEEAIKRAWRAKGVKEVIDEIIVDPSGSSGTYAQDSWIATRLKTRLLFDKNIYSINYAIEVVRGNVYILGVAQDRYELDLVLTNARRVEYVQRVVSYVLLKDDPRRTGMPPGSVTNGGTTTTAPSSSPTGTTGYEGANPTAAPGNGDTGYGGSGGPIGAAAPRGGGTIQSVPLDPPPTGQ